MAWWNVGYRLAQSAPEKLPGRFIAFKRPGLFGGSAHKLLALSQSHSRSGLCHAWELSLELCT